MRRRVAIIAGVVAVLVWPWVLPVPTAIVDDATRAAIYALVATSLVLLTGWVGQISLAQATFVGIGALSTAWVFRTWDIPFPLSLPFAVMASVAVAVLLGVVALRVRGLYLAVATLIFAWMADAWLFTASWFVGAGGSASVELEYIGQEGSLPAFDPHNPRAMYLLAVAFLALGMYVAANLRDSKTGRAFAATRGSEVGAASLGVDITAYKLLAFGISGALAGLAGHLQMVWQGTVVPTEFNFLKSLFYLSIAVVGGLTSLTGAVAAGVLFSSLNEIFFRVSALNGYIDLVSGLLLLTVLLAYPGGLAAAGESGWRRLEAAVVRIRILAQRLAAAVPVSRSGAEGGDRQDAEIGAEDEALEAIPAGSGDSADDHVEGHAPDLARLSAGSIELPPDREDRHAILEATDITVRFGGLVAVDAVSVSVRSREIVGLIGPNGAGKTTMFNAIAGLNDPASGEVHLFGTDVSGTPVHRRAAMGVGRTFQLIQLFPHLNVFDNILVGTHTADPTSWVQHLVVTELALAADRAARQRTRDVIEMLDLQEVAHRRVQELPFGVLRIVEFARALVTGAPLIMLDEPASGLDNTETEQFAELLRFSRAEFGTTILLIEHDVPMVTAVSDYIYVLNRGRLLAEGTPEAVQSEQEVIAAYLGEPVEHEVVPAG